MERFLDDDGAAITRLETDTSLRVNASDIFWRSISISMKVLRDRQWADPQQVIVLVDQLERASNRTGIPTHHCALGARVRALLTVIVARSRGDGQTAALMLQVAARGRELQKGYA